MEPEALVNTTEKIESSLSHHPCVQCLSPRLTEEVHQPTNFREKEKEILDRVLDPQRWFRGSGGQGVRWLGGQGVRWSGGQVVKWSGGQVVRPMVG